MTYCRLLKETNNCFADDFFPRVCEPTLWTVNSCADCTYTHVQAAEMFGRHTRPHTAHTPTSHGYKINNDHDPILILDSIDSTRRNLFRFRFEVFQNKHFSPISPRSFVSFLARNNIGGCELQIKTVSDGSFLYLQSVS